MTRQKYKFNKISINIDIIMKTYKLPISIDSEEDKSYIKDLCRQQSIR